MEEQITIDYAGRQLTISTGALAKQADGSVVVRYGDAVVLVTVVVDKRASAKDFLPLTVNYHEMSYAAGKFPGGFFKREGRPSEREILMSRLIDRPLRPLFPKGFTNEVQVIATVLSADQENDPAIMGILGASCALTISEIPFDGPLAGVKVGRKNGSFVINPTPLDLEESELDVVVTGNKEAIIMVEGQAKFVNCEDLIEAIHFGHQKLIPLIEIQEQLKEKVGRQKWEVIVDSRLDALVQELKGKAEEDILKAFSASGKQERSKKQNDVFDGLISVYPDIEEALMKTAFEEITRDILRKQLFATSRRIDGRTWEDIRPLSCQAGILPRTHGSALFTRGETQALALTTFGTSEDEQKVESLMEGETFKTFMLHYNFTPFSVGEVAMLRGPTRREIGHGNLAERALTPILPPKEDFPYTIRIVSEILESNGSSSMATVCSGCLSLMDAGVPIKEPVAGIAMGLVKEGDNEIILSDILGDEDHLGDMDFKIAGTRDAITAIQMDIKIKGISKETMQKAVVQGQKGIRTILDAMAQTLEKPRETMSPYAPRIFTIRIKPDKIRDVIGPGGKIIRGIVEQTGVKIDIEDDGMVKIASIDEGSANQAIDIIKKLTKEAELGEIYTGKIKKIIDSGVIVEILPGVEGYVHVSQLAEGYVKKATDVVKEREEITVKVIEIDPTNGRIKLSRKAALKEQKAQE
ncbi:MAG TPA: polyribonucleotide nucleotidyltransferase [Syntrophorhabdus sp.]|jgi:polyribonucleotide nucleotidyltransferase|nr:MAG: Polyribonucleotide nucleotidyltransferase [Syntrophorhabdus sp. PtaB.Bin027]HOD78057.1 polyribonucleotide nucleotidyltransferase [Syntrophorhabdus sp.]HPB37205.1 polyribonucleotide nucleotidyltransferase [Syntrophorhabdus sp.]HPW36288.1 polyribonucleotide nucleotidyltransferase [Syntrophorhabdus sp.]HQB34371.1 polyribonucleotide nucleotidyltransferase [Syntrophorhabdus sp.]